MGHEYRATIEWIREGALFTDNKYSRRHTWRFDGGLLVSASSSPSIVPLPYSLAEAVDPEEALVAATSSCHMLFFLAHAAKQGFLVDRYMDQAVGTMTQNERGKLFVSKIILRPEVTFAVGKTPTPQQLELLHHEAHEDCFIANSLRTEIFILLPGDCDK